MKRNLEGSGLLPASALIARQLKSEILRGEMNGGDRLLQDVIATRFGVSQTIVREAFKELAAHGFLDAPPRRGVSVALLTAEDAAELIRLRSALEVQALELAIPNLTKADIARATALVNEMESSRDAAEVIHLNSEFHDCLYEPSAQKRTLALIVMLRQSFDRYFRFACDETGHVPKSHSEHLKLLKLCARKDVEGATTLLRQHIVGTGDAIAAGLKAQMSQPSAA